MIAIKPRNKGERPNPRNDEENKPWLPVPMSSCCPHGVKKPEAISRGKTDRRPCGPGSNTASLCRLQTVRRQCIALTRREICYVLSLGEFWYLLDRILRFLLFSFCLHVGHGSCGRSRRLLGGGWRKPQLGSRSEDGQVTTLHRTWHRDCLAGRFDRAGGRHADWVIFFLSRAGRACDLPEGTWSRDTVHWKPVQRSLWCESFGSGAVWFIVDKHVGSKRPRREIGLPNDSRRREGPRSE